MLSHLYRIASEFEQRHGVAPNLLYLNYQQVEQLKRVLPGLQSTVELLLKLKMELVLQGDTVHPRVAWSSMRAKAG